MLVESHSAESSYSRRRTEIAVLVLGRMLRSQAPSSAVGRAESKPKQGARSWLQSHGDAVSRTWCQPLVIHPAGSLQHLTPIPASEGHSEGTRGDRAVPSRGRRAPPSALSASLSARPTFFGDKETNEL